jgi:FtsH-binding integral membrane protein
MAFSPDFRTLGARSTTQADVSDAGLRGYMLRVYNWMASGLLLTGAVSFGVAHSSLIDLFYQRVATPTGIAIHPTGLAMLTIFAPLAFVLVLSFGITRLSKGAAQAIYWLFCLAMGLSLTNIFLIYANESIARTFFITAGTFAGMSLWGYTTRTDLTRFGSFLIMGLIGLILAMVVNIFVHSGMLQFVTSIAGVLIFTGLTAFDTQRIKSTYVQYAYADGPDQAAKRAVYDALSLFLNFINLFMMLLQLTGNRRGN